MGGSAPSVYHRGVHALVALVVSVVAASGCFAQKGSPPGTVAEGELADRFDRALQRSAPSFWGAVLVAVDGKVVFAKGYGLADRLKVPIGPQSLFDLGGASQQLTAIAALRLVAEQKLLLDASLGKVFAEWPAERAAMALRDLLRHSSGLPPTMAWSGSSAQNAKAAQAAFAKVALTGRIGATSAYSPANANLLALLIEVAAAQRFEKVLLERVCKPAGMPTATPLGQRADPKLVTARRLPTNERGDSADKAECNWSVRGASGVLASVYDVHALLGALVGDTLLSAEARTMVWQPLAGTDYAVTAVAGNGASFVRVAGQCAGYRARWTVDATSRSWVVLLTEDYGATDAVETSLVAEAWQAVAQKAAPTPPAAGTPTTSAPPSATAGAWAPAEKARFVGAFTLPRGGGTFRIEAAGDSLRLVGIGLQASARLLEGRWPPPGEDRLRTAEDRGLSLLERVLADDASVDQQAFTVASVGAAARAELRAFVKQQGKKPQVQYIGTTPQGHGESWFRVIGDKAEVVVRAAWLQATQWERCVVTQEPLPFAVELTSLRPDVATATLRNGRQIVLSIEGRGDSRSLLYEDATAGDDGLLDCPLAVSGR